jgi:cobalt-zinc-cadmium resistance protein CzcA
MKVFKLLPMLIPFWVSAQRDSVTVEAAIKLGLQNNPGIKAATQQVLVQQQLKKTATDVPKTEFSYLYGQYNSIVKDNNLTVMQAIPFPTVFSSRAALANSQIKTSEAKKAVTENELIFQIRETGNRLLYLNERKIQLQQQDSLYDGLARAATKKLQAGEGTRLEMTKAIAQQNEIRNLLNQNLADQAIYELHLQALLNHPNPVSVAWQKFEPLPFPGLIDSVDAETNPTLQYMKQQVTNAKNVNRLEKARVLPEFKLGLFSQTLVGTQKINGQDQFFGRDKRFTGLQVGLSLPIWFVPQAAQVKAGGIAMKSTQSEYDQSKINWWAQTRSAFQQANKFKASLEYYGTSGLPMAKLIQQQALLSFKQGEISFTEFLISVNQAIGIREAYLQTLFEYNQSIIQIEFLTAQMK